MKASEQVERLRTMADELIEQCESACHSECSGSEHCQTPCEPCLIFEQTATLPARVAAMERVVADAKQYREAVKEAYDRSSQAYDSKVAHTDTRLYLSLAALDEMEGE